MTSGELDALERDVENARGRLRIDLARLRSPGTLARAKDEMVGRASDATQDTAHRVFEDIKSRAAANPVAALAIGAGLAWRFAHRPPIASLLVGAGLVSLLKTNPQERHAGADFVARTGDFAGAVKETISEKIDQLSRSDIAARAGELTDTVKDKAGQWSAQTGDFASEALSKVSSTASSLARDGSRIAASAIQEDRDTYLLGAAAVALAAAIGISYQRGAS